ncbi:hypothetical protein [Brasilonema sp. UFV-L1]|nr:hypothetical protein [Brasilonema sp. UFV-L1]
MQPHLPLENGSTVEQQHVLSPFGEIIANQDFPGQQSPGSQKKDASFIVD